MRGELIEVGRTDRIIGAAMKVHRALGPGLLESAYEACLAHELASVGFRVERRVPLPVEYDGLRPDAGYRLDILVDQRIILEQKAVERIEPIHKAQLLTYLRLSGLQVALLMNFNVEMLRDGIVRRVMTHS